MWFIEGDMLLKVAAAVLMFAAGLYISDKVGLISAFRPFSVLISLWVLWCFSERLCLFYLVYIFVTYALIALMRRIKHARKVFFVLFCVIFVTPFLLFRCFDLAEITGIFVLLGFSYNMLKAVDALFYVYYTDEKIRVMTYLNFMLFFAVFTAGPIFRYRDYIKAYDAMHPVTWDEAGQGLRRFILGMFKKVVLVTALTFVYDRLAQAEVFHWYTSLSVIGLSYVILYLDLSGYSDMAVGVGRMVSIEVPENFKKPWTAPSFTQFWRKWHVTLSDWIREHIFVVVQGKKLNRYQSALIGFITMIVMSLWHEFSIETVIGGVYMGLFLVIENIFSLSTFNVRKEKKYKYVIRCFLVNFFFAVNAMSFSMDLGSILRVLRGLVRL